MYEKAKFEANNTIMKQIKRYYTFSVEPHDVYNALTNKLILEIWTREEVVMELEPNTEFSLWGGSITGINLEFEKNKKLVQQWFFEGDDDEKSIVTMKIHPHKKGTSLELLHTNIPDDAYENISRGWDEDYFGALGELLI